MTPMVDDLVSQYQQTNDELYLALVIAQVRTEIQTRAHNTSITYGIDEADVESALVETVWKCLNEYDASTGVPFKAYLYLNFKYAIKHEIDRVAKLASATKRVELEYTLSADETFDLYDPRQDVENLLAEQDAAQKLYEHIREADKTAALIAVLKATGRDYNEIGELLDYNPQSKNKKQARKDWASNRMKKARIATIKYYLSHPETGLPKNFRL